ncbi:hypothetical protein QS306_08550 [Paraburkholderia bonniea]|uniref:hypothetical protein n=1 Tax=Paraburkholderia bonniea TaxID=2152891 RepID=UPI001290A1B6|nr:hypothetical protein [Paraburkholderia bonniea]WJF91487.1 hypothetical protein QS306_08550 [Paraburkholderia bonniea]WJF94805.1 hypothetical protein QS308_08560 [Paraburkholderia bonniea]
MAAPYADFHPRYFLALWCINKQRFSRKLVAFEKSPVKEKARDKPRVKDAERFGT